MTKKKKKLTFSDYFEMTKPTEEIIAPFGYTFAQRPLDNLPSRPAISPDLISQLEQILYQTIPAINMVSETAKREFMVAPLLSVLLRQISVKLYIEYPLEINHALSGSLDYLLRAKQQLVVIEAKRGDLDRGLTQLAVELIALDHYEPPMPTATLYGAITVGDIWRFATLDRAAKLITKDIHTYRVPEDLSPLFNILIGILH